MAILPGWGTLFPGNVFLYQYKYCCWVSEAISKPCTVNTALKLSEKHGKKKDLHKNSNAATWAGNTEPTKSPKTGLISTTLLSYFLSWGPVKSGSVALWSRPTCKKSYEQGFGLLLTLSAVILLIVMVCSPNNNIKHSWQGKFKE